MTLDLALFAGGVLAWHGLAAPAAIDAEPTPATVPANGFHDLALVGTAR